MISLFLSPIRRAFSIESSTVMELDYRLSDSKYYAPNRAGGSGILRPQPNAAALVTSAGTHSATPFGVCLTRLGSAQGAAGIDARRRYSNNDEHLWKSHGE